MIPGLSTLKTWALAGLGALSAVLFGWGQYQKRKRIEDEHEDVQNAQRVERQDAEITTAGLVDEAKTSKEAEKINIVDHFQ